MTVSTGARTVSAARAWSILAVGVVAQTATTALIAAPALLLPVLQQRQHLAVLPMDVGDGLT